METRDRLRLALYIFLVSLVLRVAWASWADIVPVSDFATYDALGWRWATTGSFGSSAYRTPGYPGFLALVYSAFGHSWKAAALIQAVLGAATSAMVVLLAARLLSARAAAIAGLLYTFSPAAIAYVPVLASENLAVFLLMFGLLLLAAAQRAARRGRSALTLVSGLVLGLLLLVRPAAVWFAPAWLVLAGYSPRPRRFFLVPPLLAVAGASLVLTPWIVRNQRLGLGSLTLSTVGGVNLWMGNNDLATTGGYLGQAQELVPTEGMSDIEADRAYWAAATAWIGSNPGRYLSLCGTRFARLLGVWPDTWAARYLPPWPVPHGSAGSTQAKAESPASSQQAFSSAWESYPWRRYLLAGVRAVLAPLVLLSLVLSFSRWRDYLIVVLPAAAYIVGLSLTYVQIRFRVLVDPLLFVPVAGLLSDVLFGTQELGSRLTRSQKTFLSMGLVLATFVAHATGVASGLYQLEPQFGGMMQVFGELIRLQLWAA